MKWATSKVVHFDRVISAWLIVRFIDPDAEFEFIDGLPPGGDQTPFGIAGAVLGPHDEAGSGFSKIIDHYKLVDPALEQLRVIVEQTVKFALNDGIKVADAPQNALLGIAEGIMLESPDDAACLRRSLPIYDALYRGIVARLDAATAGLAETVRAATYRITSAVRHMRAPEETGGPSTSDKVSSRVAE